MQFDCCATWCCYSRIPDKPLHDSSLFTGHLTNISNHLTPEVPQTCLILTLFLILHGSFEHWFFNSYTHHLIKASTNRIWLGRIRQNFGAFNPVISFLEQQHRQCQLFFDLRHSLPLAKRIKSPFWKKFFWFNRKYCCQFVLLHSLETPPSFGSGHLEKCPNRTVLF